MPRTAGRDQRRPAKLYHKILKSYSNTSFAKDAAEELARLQAGTSRH